MGEGVCNTREVGMKAAQMCVAKREEIDDAPMHGEKDKQKEYC